MSELSCRSKAGRRARRLGEIPRVARSQGKPRGGTAAICDDDLVPISVLIVDDHSEFRAVARELLEDAGYQVTGEAASAAEAIAAVAAQSPDIVLLDVGLPDGNGFEVASRISHRSGGPIVVLVSSREAEDYGRRVARSGARGFLSKSRLSAATLASVLG